MIVSYFSKAMLAHRRTLAFVLHAAVAGLVLCAAFLLRFDGIVPRAVLPVLWRTLPLAMAIRMLTFGAFRLHRGLWQFASMHDLARLIQANTVSTALFAAAVWLLFGYEGFPRSVFLIDWTLAIVVFGGKRFALRLLMEKRNGRRAPGSGADALRTVIAGAGEAGVIALRELHRTAARPHRVIGFLDDAPAKQNMTVQGVPVLGTLADAPSIVRAHGVAELVVAMPSAPKKIVRDLIERCAGNGVTLRILPAVADAMSSRLEALPLREVDLDDLLGREPIRLDRAPVEAAIMGKRVLVTGAAGSIGSEIARQVAAMKPAHLTLLDMAESPLFEIDLALARTAPDVPRTAVVGDVRLAERMRRLLRQCRPDCVFHAAAYKHVPLMQAHPLQAIENNALGTWNTAVAAQEAGASRFILISTDKAVMPANVMGASKRMAEMLVSGLNGNGTAFMAVRFGNVLGSNGSVVPIFRRQIAAGGPVTVTHPEMTRYFMTIPEAVALVLQAGAVGAGGDMFLLDMGEPVRIVDMARNLIRLSGLKPGRDIEIAFTGLRPGEKLTEELSAYQEVATPTGIPRLNRLADHAAAFEGADVRAAVATLRAAVDRGDEAAAVRALWQAVGGEDTVAAESPLGRSIVPETAPSPQFPWTSSEAQWKHYGPVATA